jgi:hypothetical protein
MDPSSDAPRRSVDANQTSIFTFRRDTLILPLVSGRTGGSRNDGAFGHCRVSRRSKLCLPGLFGGGDVSLLVVNWPWAEVAVNCGNL